MKNLFTVRPQDMLTEANSQDFIMRQFLLKHAFISLGLVRGVSESGDFVDVQPMIHGFSGGGDKIERGTIFGAPVWRLQRGSSAIIMKPMVGDIGLIAMCDRDISTVKSTKSPALPNSNRSHSYADAIYLGGVLNGAPTQYVEFSDKINIISPSGINLNGVTIHPDGRLELVTGVVVDTHVHGGVESGGDTTSTPE
ncbi:Uncharacterised protein [Serratia marcescens]|nr:Uncharacterised protein [Serratia marcescens]